MTKPPRYLLECRNISFLSTVTGDKWFSRLYSPPVIAQFLNDVSIEAFSGGVHAVCGVSGSGKSTLLNVIANNADGDTTGSVLLNHSILTKERFNQVGSSVQFHSNYPSELTVYNLIFYNMKLHFGSLLSQPDFEQRIATLMNEFEIVNYAHMKMYKLSESAKRRVQIAIAASKDPVLLLLDDPCRDIESLSSFQLMNCLHNYASLYNRIVLISIQSPRSDTYQLLQTMTILFYGEVFYSGLTKKLPHYFSKAGFPCPTNENPAAYYISIATIDRETASRCNETQEQAMHLVSYYKDHQSQKKESSEIETFAPPSALCYLKSPSSFMKILLLCRRNMNCLLTDIVQIIINLSIFPIAAIFMSIFSLNMLTGSWTIPHSSSAFLEISVFLLTVILMIVTVVNYAKVRDFSYFESSQGLYNQMISAFSFFIVFGPINLMGLAIFTVLILWMSNLTEEWLIAETFLVVVCVCSFFQFSTMVVMLIVKDNVKVIGFMTILNLLLLIGGGGHLRSFVTMSPSWLSYFTYFSPYRYSNYFFISNIVSRLPITNCNRNERSEVHNSSKFCRWNLSSSYSEEQYSSSFDPYDIPSNCAICFMLSILSFIFMILIHSLKKSKHLVNKFKFH